MHDPPSYTAGDEFPFISEKKVNSSSTLPPSPSTSTYSSTYAPSPAPFSLTAALNVSQPGGQNTLGRQPISFTRTRSQGAGFTYTPFKPIFLFTTGDSSGQSTSLSNGFPMTPPPSKENPHPFVTHDVNEIDWLQFLNDVNEAGSLTEKDIQRSHIPIVSRVPFVGNLSVYGVQKYMKSRKSSSVARTIDVWNHHFFETRNIRIVLMRGNERLTGLQDDPEQGVTENASGEADKKGKGKSKEESHVDVYRLFVTSV